MIAADWRLFILVHIVCTGVWGVMAKMAAARLNVRTATFVAVLSASILVSAVSARHLQWQSLSGVVYAAIAGMLGGIASLTFYAAIREAPASLVVPLSSLYPLVTVLVAALVLRESVGLREIAGILLGITAFVLLAR